MNGFPQMIGKNAKPDLKPGEKELITVEGIIENIVYQNSENGYTVADVATATNEMTTLVGIMPYASAGETITAMGNYEVHASFGRQFKVQYYEKKLPATEGAILRYLASGTIKGIGTVTARKIVERFGCDTFTVLENNPGWLSDIPGISAKKAEAIGQEFQNQFGLRSVMTFCREFFGPQTVMKIYKKWGVAAIDIIKENPYKLCDEIYGIGFETADKMAAVFGVSNDSLPRVNAGICYALSYNAQNNGHVFLPYKKLVPICSDLLGVSDEKTEEGLNALSNERKIEIVEISGRRCVYLKSYFEAESYTAYKLELLDRICPKLDMDDIDRFITQIELEEGITYASMQRKAIRCALSCGVMVLTGGPGTGKTTVIRAVLRVFERIGYKIALAAPTGRAAKRMSEATQREAKTIHRLLEMEYSDNDYPRFKRNEGATLDENVVILDESSMIDTQLMASLLKAVKPGTHLILIGDADQLPSVGAGNVLSEIIKSECFGTVELKEIFRQEHESLIISNAHSINSGEYPSLENRSDDFFFIPRENENDIAKTVADLITKRLPRRYGSGIAADIQVITPTRKGVVGTYMLNAMLQGVLNPKSQAKREKPSKSRIFRVGDKVMQIKNNYDIAWVKNGSDGVGIFNGDIGVIDDINFEEESVSITFDERSATYDFTMLDELDHAYAITVHKSQGSEYPIVIIPAFGNNMMLYTRNLLYTAVTRAQQMVIIVGKREVIFNMVDNNKKTVRYTTLKHFLIDKIIEKN